MATTYNIGQCVVNNTDGHYYISPTERLNLFIHGDIPVSPLKRIGVQSRPGAEFMIGEELIRIGRSGVYELSSDLIEITKMYVKSKDIFIIDYRY